MNTQQITPETLGGSVISVPPLARNEDGTFNRDANQQIIQHLEAGGVTTVLYGGNAILYHVALSEYGKLLSQISDIANENTLAIPSVGPAYGMMMDQAAVLREFSFPTAMVLPTRDVATPAGVGRGFRQFVNAIDKPAVLYIKHEGYVDVPTVKGLVDDGLVSWIKYAIVRENTSDDEFLRELVDTVGAHRIISGIGEQPAITHLRDFGLQGFTSGCVCVAPQLSTNMLTALKAGNYDKAEQIRQTFAPLEDLRNKINPVRVLHTALAAADIAETGPMIPLLSEIEDAESVEAISIAASDLMARDSA